MSRHDQRAGRSGRLARSAERDRLEIASVARAPATFRRGPGIPQLSIWAHRPECYPHPPSPDAATLWLTHGSAWRLISLFWRGDDDTPGRPSKIPWANAAGWLWMR